MAIAISVLAIPTKKLLTDKNKKITFEIFFELLKILFSLQTFFKIKLRRFFITNISH